MQFVKAKRSRAKLRLSLTGVSGSGKTMSALLIAKGLGGRIALIDSENKSAELYDDVADWDVCPLTAPYTPERYVEAIHAAEAAGYAVIIIDSLSHAWAGEGGVLDYHGKLTDGGGEKNSFTAWRKVNPKQNMLVEAMLKSPAHIIATIRSKTEYVIEENEKGQKVPRKVGLAPVQRDGLEYEFTVAFEISDTHMARATKDRTRLFDSVIAKLTEEDGAKLAAWLEGGAEPAPSVPATPAPDADLAALLKQQWAALLAHYGSAADVKANLKLQIGEKPFSAYTADDAAKIADLIRGWETK